MIQTQVFDAAGRQNSTTDAPFVARYGRLYRLMVLARAVDRAKADLVSRGEAYFHIPGNGHEASAVVGLHLTPDDWLHLHYRDKALMLARGLTPEDFLNSVLCNAESHSQGRQMSAMMCSRRLHLLSVPTLVGNSALQAVGVAAALAEANDSDPRPIVVCSMGDGTTQQGEVLEALAEAARNKLPILFLIEDNGYSISTRTAGRTFFSHAGGAEPDEVFGIPIVRLDGRDAVACDAPLGEAIGKIRGGHGPAVVVLRLERLSNHTNADDERVYRGEAERSAAAAGDPLAVLRERLAAAGMSDADLQQIEIDAYAEVEAATHRALAHDPPQPVFDAKAPMPAELCEAREIISAASSNGRAASPAPSLTMLEAIREVLGERLASDPAVVLLGQDIEDPKGDVFGVTRGLSTRFGGRVLNAPLSESTIVGTSIGRAFAGQRPVAFIQFADFLPVAFNQILSELGSMYWRTAGQWQCPVVILAACGGYRPGLGPFHSQTFEALGAHVPGLDVVMPANAGDAAGLLNAAFRSGRPTLFLYPKVCLNDPDDKAPAAACREAISPGKCRFLRRGDELTIVTWGNGVKLCDKAAAALESAGASVDLIDLRSISPWDRAAVVESASRTSRLLVVHEDSRTCGFGAEVVATVAEEAATRVAVRRITRPDTYVPFNFNNQLEVLPSLRSVLTAAAELLDFDLRWKRPTAAGPGVVTIEAVGSSPADQNVTVVSWKIAAGDKIRVGDILADMEADKAVYELTSPVEGIVDEALIEAGKSVRIHTPLLTIRTGREVRRSRQVNREEAAAPILTRRAAKPRPDAARALTVGMSGVYPACGSMRLTNDDLAARFTGRTAADIFQRTGIESRPLAADGENVYTLALRAATDALAGERLSIGDITAVVCSTTTPADVTPSLAGLLLGELSSGGDRHEAPCHDVLAACSGYIYALAAGFDHLQARPDGRVLVVTSEVLSRVVDPNDFDTAILFGDAATATILYGPAAGGRSVAQLRRPVLSGRGDPGRILSVPLAGNGHIRMDGKKVFTEAVRSMGAVLRDACRDAGVELDQLDLIVPHQANGRIIEAMRPRLGLAKEKIADQMRAFGNTSSSSIPLCLANVLAGVRPAGKIGICAFGGGFTFGAAIMETGK